MNRLRYLRAALISGASLLSLNHAAAREFNIPQGDLAVALDAYTQQAGVDIIYSDDAIRGHRTKGAKGNYTEIAALTEVLKGTGFTTQTTPSNAVGIVAQQKPEGPTRVAQAERKPVQAPSGSSVETVVVTAQHKAEDIQQVPIAVTALSQRQLTQRQVAGGPDLVKQVPNLNFSKTNFSGYNIEIRGIGTQAISVTTDPAVAVAFNGIPFLRNHFFEQEFYDLDNVEVLRGPQGTLYGRNATAGVINMISAKPIDTYEALVSADFGNYSNERYEGMVNIPIVGDTLDLRVAGEWTKRDGYSFNTLSNQPIDGRDLWSGRATLRWKPNEDVQAFLVWEHFSEADNRMRTAKQLCKTDPGPTEVDGVPVNVGEQVVAYNPTHYVTQGCLPASLYSSDSFEVPNGRALPYYGPLTSVGAPITGVDPLFDPYAGTTQSRSLRDIEAQLSPNYKAKNDTVELNVDYNVSPSLTFSSQTGYNNDWLWSAEDYNRFNTAEGAFLYETPAALGGGNSSADPNRLGTLIPDPNGLGLCAGNGGNGDQTCKGLPLDAPCKPPPGAYVNTAGYACLPAGVFCDPQLGCSDRLVAEDLSEERSWQISQEFRFASHFAGPLNFSVGGNFLHYETEENYFVFINTLSMAAYGWSTNGQTLPYVPGVSDNSNCIRGGFQNSNPFSGNQLGIDGGSDCMYIDPHPLGSLNNKGHNYFLSQNPYTLNSYAGFGEVYYDVLKDLKLTGGLRWTEDQKRFTLIPSELLISGYGYPSTGIVKQQWDQLTGRAVANWTPNLDFTDQTLVYASYSHGYKAGGANPPGAELTVFGGYGIANPIHPLTFKPEFIDAYELGTKNTMLDGALTLNGDVFFYDYTGYQISRIVDRTSINDNFNATVKGAELETTWEPVPGLKFNLAGGYEDSRIANGQSSIDLIDRTAGNPSWMVIKPFVTQASNCILPLYVVAADLIKESGSGHGVAFACDLAYNKHLDPVTELPYVQNPTGIFNGLPAPPGYVGFDPLSIDPHAPPGVNNGLGLPPNNGEGFAKNLGGNQLPNAPNFTASLSAEYTMPVSEGWAATLHGDFYWQSQSWARVFNDKPYDKIHGYSTANLALTLTSANGWEVMGYVKNVFDTTAITGDFLNSDDSGLTTNVFLTDPRLYGIRITKHLDEGDGFWGSEWSGADWVKDIFEDTDNGRPLLWIELGGELDSLDANEKQFVPPFILATPRPAPETISPLTVGNLQRYSHDEDAKITFQPEGSDWIISAAIRYGRSSADRKLHQQSYPMHGLTSAYGSPFRKVLQFIDAENRNSEAHEVMDFRAGKDVGLGMLGEGSSSVFSLGVRIAQFESKSNVAFRSDPDAHPTFKYAVPLKVLNGGVYHFNTAAARARRSFHGVGPSLSWDASIPAMGNSTDGEIAFDWGVNAALLFGRQHAHVHHHTTAQYHEGKYASGSDPFRTTLYQNAPTDKDRSRSVMVPNLGGFAGLSVKYRNAKVSFGYRADEFFGAMDGGLDAHKSENRGFFGPYAKISIGLGG